MSPMNTDYSTLPAQLVPVSAIPYLEPPPRVMLDLHVARLATLGVARILLQL